MKAKILLIEDDESFIDTVTLLLRNDPVEIVSARTGAAGADQDLRHLWPVGTSRGR